MFTYSPTLSISIFFSQSQSSLRPYHFSCSLSLSLSISLPPARTNTHAHKHSHINTHQYTHQYTHALCAPCDRLSVSMVGWLLSGLAWDWMCQTNWPNHWSLGAAQGSVGGSKIALLPPQNYPPTPFLSALSSPEHYSVLSIFLLLYAVYTLYTLM